MAAPAGWVPSLGLHLSSFGLRPLGAKERQVRRPPKALSWPQGSLLLNAHCSRSCCRKFVVTKGNIAQMYHAPGRKREFNAFVLDKTYFGPYDETTCIDWTDDSR